jgi:hypothetical protein
MRPCTAVSLGLSLAGVVAGCAMMTGSSTGLDWDRVPATTLTLFYPAQSSYQWLRGPDHAGAAAVEQGMACTTCHAGQEAKLGTKLVAPNALEPAAVGGKRGTIDLRVQVAYDDQNAYFRLQWRGQGKQPGDAYPVYRYDGKQWTAYGQPRLHPAARKGEQPAIYEDRLSMLIDDG